jgi:hypothetical protein
MNKVFIFFFILAIVTALISSSVGYRTAERKKRLKLLRNEEKEN